MFLLAGCLLVESLIIAPINEIALSLSLSLMHFNLHKHRFTEMKSCGGSMFQVLFFFIFSISQTTLCDNHENFLQCFAHKTNNATSQIIYTPCNPLYPSVLNVSINNLRFATPSTPKPLVIVTPKNVSHIQATIYCARKCGLQIRIRSGGHDFEGLSYVSPVPFLVLDLINLRSISVDTKSKTAWVQTGSTLGELYYHIANASNTLAFPAGICPTVGVGGHISGGGIGMLSRKYGLAVDQVIDALFIDVNGEILNRKSMGEGVFWAIRGSGGNSFGVVLAWKVNLVPVPSTVTVFEVQRSLAQNATELVHRWQEIAPKLPEEILVAVNSSHAGNGTLLASFVSLYLGKIDTLIPMMQKNFPELGLTREDCMEMSWIESILVVARIPLGTDLKVLLDRTQLKVFYKSKSDYVTNPIPESAIEGIWDRFSAEEAQLAYLLMTPSGGKISEISNSATPYPHRSGNLYNIQYVVSWIQAGTEASERHIDWIRSLYNYMTPYVSKNPRQSYINFRDLDIGTNNIEGNTSYEQASIWGIKYFVNNFDRLVHVKTKVDPIDFFRNEQSIPPSNNLLEKDRSFDEDESIFKAKQAF